MKVTPDDYGRRCQFDHFCKLVLYHEAVDYFRERKRQRGWETSFETLPLSELDTLCTIDQYPSDSFIFPAYGCELQISDGLVAAAFSSLPQPGQSILILHCVLELTDGEIGAVVGMSRSAVQRHRTKTLSELRKQLKALMPKGGKTRMNNPNYKGIELLPLSVIEAARAGDAEAVERVLRYYSGYMNKLCTRTLYELDGTPHVRVDEYMKHRLQNKLIRAILKDSL